MPVRLCPGHRRRRNDLDEQQLRLLLCRPLRVQPLPTASNQHEDQLHEHLLTNKQPSHGPWMASQLVGCDCRFEVTVENGFIFSHQLVVKSPLAAIVPWKIRAVAQMDTSATTAAAARHGPLLGSASPSQSSPSPSSSPSHSSPLSLSPSF